MDKRNSLRPKQKTKLQLKVKLVFIGGMLLAVSLLIGIKFQKKQNKTLTNIRVNSKTKVNFNWDTDEITANIGPDAESVSDEAYIDPLGSSGPGLNAGDKWKAINLKLPSKVLDVKGMDVSIDFQRDEPGAYFISRGKEFLFGMRKGKLGVRYTILDKRNKRITISVNNVYKIPKDDTFRNYRFKYDQNVGIATIFVDNIVVWESKKTPGCPLAWTKKAPVWIGKYMDGEGSDKPLIDNLIINEITSL